MATSLLLLLLLGWSVADSSGDGGDKVEVYVSASGSDTNDGRSPVAPLRHLLAAQLLVRKLRAGMAHPATVWLMAAGGPFELPTPLNLTALDANTSWVGVPDPNRTGVPALAVLSGASPVAWTSSTRANAPSGCQIITAKLSADQQAAAKMGRGTAYPQLLVNGLRASVARAPSGALQNQQSYFTWSGLGGGGSASAFAFDGKAATPLQWSAPAADPAALNDITAMVFDAPWSAMPGLIQSIDVK